MAYDPQATRGRILTAATSEFAAHGVAGARIDRIAANARANKRAIYDYFGDKDALFAAVLTHTLSELADAVPADNQDLPAYARSLFAYHREHPDALRLLLWEALEVGDDAVPAEGQRASHYRDKIRATASATGRDEDDSAALTFLTLGMVGWTLVMPQVRRMLLGPDVTADRLEDIVTAGVRALSTAFTSPGEE